MKRVELNGTYGYENFISDEEQNFLLNWVSKNESLFHINQTGSDTVNAPYGSRKMCILSNFKNAPIELVTNIKNRIIDIENIGEWIEEPYFKDAIGINGEGGAIHTHSDPNIDGYTHTRYNVILSYPIEGGHSIYDGRINILKEKMVWKCVAGKVKHGSTNVVGPKPRITLTLGFQIKDKAKQKKSLI
jgi:hypothetical protein